MPTFGGIVVATGGAPASGRRTLLDITTELARPINATDTTILALAGDAFRAAVGRMNIKGNWPWEVQDEDVAITLNNKFSSVSGTIKKPLAMHFLDEAGGVRDQPISYQSYEVFVEKYTMDVSSEPHTYTFVNLFETGQIRWFPTPSSNDNARFSYYRATPEPRAEQEVVEIPEHVMQVYMAIAWEEFLKRVPAVQRPFSIAVAMDRAQRAFNEISAHVTSPGDRSRRMNAIGGRN